ncbi:MAG: hypothetical protein IJC67_00705, partial [Clostridia bacterium]|nr:hypothetical protein [Clostridia bacterium]
MKKFVLGILLVCLACSLVACSSPADNQADSPVEQSVENVTVDLDNETADKAIENIPQEFDYAKTNVFADCAEITYIRVNSGAEISSPKPESIYHTYSATSGNVFIDFIADVKNLKDTSLAVKDLVTLVLIMGEDAHRANAIVEEDGGIDFDAYYTVAPLETVRVHFLVEVPESQKNEEMKLNVFSDTSDLLEAAFLYEEIV